MTEDNAQSFVRARCTERAFSTLEDFIDLLIGETKNQNLIAETSIDVVWSRHIADSAQLLDHLAPATGGPIVDFGSGAGLPGVVLAILRPDLRVVLIESRKLRVAWLETVKTRLNLANIQICGGDAGKISPFEAGAITARAFAPMARLLTLCAPFSTPQSVWLLPKGRSAEQEVSELPKAVQAMFHVEQSATDPEGGIIVGRGKVPIA